jgi:hypothetical protein
VCVSHKTHNSVIIITSETTQTQQQHPLYCCACITGLLVSSWSHSALIQ